MGKFFIIIILLAALGGGIYYGWSKGYISLTNQAANSDVLAIQKRGTLIVGTDATYPPLEYLDDKGQIVGFDADLANEIANDMHVKLSLKNISFDKIFDSLKNGEVDLVISSVTITTERQKEMLFSSPYFNAGQVIVIKTGEKGITDPASLKGHTVGVQKDTTSAKEATKYTSQVRVYDDYGPAKTDLTAGKIDAIIIDYPAGVSMAQGSLGSLMVVGNPFTSEFYGVAAPLGKDGLISSVNDTIQRLKNSGKLNQIENIWFKR